MILGSGQCSGDTINSNQHDVRNTDGPKSFSIHPSLSSFPPKSQLTELRPPFSKRRLRFGLCLFHADLLVQELFDEHLGVVDPESSGVLDERDAQMLGFVVVRQCVPAVCSKMTFRLGAVEVVGQMPADVALKLLAPAWFPWTLWERT